MAWRRLRRENNKLARDTPIPTADNHRRFNAEFTEGCEGFHFPTRLKTGVIHNFGLHTA